MARSIVADYRGPTSTQRTGTPSEYLMCGPCVPAPLKGGGVLPANPHALLALMASKSRAITPLWWPGSSHKPHQAGRSPGSSDGSASGTTGENIR
jgi:hypothetical protein